MGLLRGCASDGGEPRARTSDLVAAFDDRLQAFALDVNAVPRTVYRRVIAFEDVADPPAGIDLMYFEAIVDAVDARVVFDRPAVALDIDPALGRGRHHAGAVELVPDDCAARRAFLDVDILRSGLGNVVVRQHIVVTCIRLAAGVPAPVLVRRPYIKAFTEEGLQQSSSPNHAFGHHGMCGERSQMNALLADRMNEQAIDEDVRHPVGHDALLPTFYRETKQPPPGGPVHVQHIALVNAVALQHGAPAAAQCYRRGRCS